MIGFPAYHSTEYRSSLPASVLESAVIEAFEGMGISIERAFGRYEGRMPFNFWSFGEILSVTIGPDGQLQITSKCVMPTQCFDWGKNRRNVEKLVELIETSKLSVEAIDIGKIQAEVESTGVSPVEKIFAESD